MNRIHRLPLAAACAAAAASAAPARACSLAPFPITRDGVHLIGTATADTLRAGTGGRQYATGDGHSGPGGVRAVYGQVVRVERLGGSDAVSLPAGAERVVLVPWDYGADCRRTLWTASARWVEPGTRGLFWAGLRPREQWVDGLPTLDVGDPYHLPYTPERAAREGDAEDGDAVMSIEQAFDFLGMLPLWDEYQADEEGAALALVRWAREHPELAHRFPASMAVRHAEYGVRYARLKRIEPPLAGTYRFAVSVDGDAPRTFYARTRSAPTTEWDPAKSPADDEWQSPALDDPIAGYTLLLVGSAVADSLPVVCGPDRDMSREGYVSVATEPEPGADGVQVWQGDVELSLAARALPGDSLLARITRGEWDETIRRMQAEEPPLEREQAPARFRLRPDGAVTVEQTRVMHDGRTVVITGERISAVTIPDPG